MKFINKKTVLAFLLAAASAKAVPPPPTATFNTTGFTLNPAFILSVFNVVKQNNNLVTQWPSDLAKYNAVVQISVVNTSTIAGHPYFSIQVSDPGCGLLFDTASAGPGLITTINPVGPGAATLGAGSFQTAGNWGSGYTVPQCFIDEVSNGFSDPSKIQSAINKFINTPFTICVQQRDSLGNAIGSPVCTQFVLFNQQSGNIVSVPILIYPHNNVLFSALPMFTWTPAQKPGLDPSKISYRIEITENDASGEPIRISIPAGQTFYQWSAADRELKVGTKYHWKAIALDPTGNPIGGSGDSGWNTTKWFEVQAGQQAAITLNDVDAIVRKSVEGDAALKAALAKLKISSVSDPANLSDDIYSQLKNGKATVTGVDIGTK
jgi:hypothetical protein